MAIADGPATTGIQRGRGGFLRSSQDTPYVTDPSGAVVKSGDRKGEPKRLPYGSPSGAGKLIENSKALEKWGERRVVLGLGTDLALIADCAALARLDVDSDEFKDAADRIVMRCKDAADANLAADRGNAIHALTELPDWMGILERGEAETALGESLGLDRRGAAQRSSSRGPRCSSATGWRSSPPRRAASTTRGAWPGRSTTSPARPSR
jgi:hypothetical protein